MTNANPLPVDADLKLFRNRARELLTSEKTSDKTRPTTIADARNSVAREYGFDDWDALRTEIEPSSTYRARSGAYDAALPPDHEFFKAVGALDLARVRKLLERDRSLANADVRGTSSLRGDWGWGAPWGDPGKGQTCRAIHFAVYMHEELLHLLIEYGADVNAFGYEGNNHWSPPLVLACFEGSRQTVRILLEASANPNLASVNGGSPLHSAINHWDPWKIEILLRYGARHDIFSAAVVGDLEEVKEQMVDVRHRLDERDTNRHRTPLEWAAFNRQEEVGEYLIGEGAQITPMVLICFGMVDELKELEKQDPEISNRPIGQNWNDPPVLWAVRSGQIDMLTYLLAAGADPNGVGGWGQMALPLAVDLPVETALQVVEVLIEAGAYIEISSGETRRTHLGQFVIKGKTDVAELLVKHGADVDFINRFGRTPLQAMIYPPSWRERYGDPLIGIEFLLAHGARINQLSHDNKTALDIALAQKNEAVATYLRDHGGVSATELS